MASNLDSRDAVALASFSHAWARSTWTFWSLNACTASG